MVIIEGPDHSGKTSLIRHIMGTFPEGYLELSEASRMSKDQRNDPRFRDPIAVHERIYQAIVEESVGINTPKVHDRLFFSELIYGEVLRGGSCISWEESVHIRRLLTAISPVIVFCLPPIREIHKHIYGSAQMEGVVENTDRIYAGYHALLALSKPKVILYDYTKGPAAKDRVCRVILKYLERRKKRVFKP